VQFLYKFQSHTQLHEIHGNQVISAHANCNRTSKKFLVSFSNENLFIDAAAKGHFSVYVRYLKISVHPQLRFLRRLRYRKINKRLRAVSCESSEGIDSGSTWLLHLSDVSRLQPSLLRLRLM
jgi:hypothetical protein